MCTNVFFFSARHRRPVALIHLKGNIPSKVSKNKKLHLFSCFVLSAALIFLIVFCFFMNSIFLWHSVKLNGNRVLSLVVKEFSGSLWEYSCIEFYDSELHFISIINFPLTGQKMPICHNNSHRSFYCVNSLYSDSSTKW